ncbi:MAG: SDR family NAD(P)-dependent oxidoreductase [Bacteroidia bacterium]|nr:SDR family NAD(P)-dependent oxidoreductase [Bacteroidia bacterium]
MLKGKTILITGGGSGIGEALVKNLSPENQIVICGRNQDKLKKVASANKNVSYYPVDLSVPEEIDHLFKQLSGNKIVLDVLFNNAGVVEQYNISKTGLSSAEIFQRINTNLSGGIAMTRHFISQANKSTENYIVNITSEIALFPVPILALYASSKAGFSVFTKVLRQQLRNTNFKVIEVLPPQIETDMPKQIGNSAKGVNADDFAKKIISTVNSGKVELANGPNVPLLKLLSKFFPDLGLRLIDKMSRKQLQVQ